MVTFKKTLGASIGAGILVLTACGGSDDGGGGDGPVQLTVHMIGYGSTLPDDDVIKAELDEQLGIDIELIAAADEGEYYNQLATSLAGGDAPDLFVANRGHLAQFVDQGLVLDLTDHLDDLPDYQAVTDPASMKAATIDDHVYALPRRLSTNGVSYWIRQDWLDNSTSPCPKRSRTSRRC